MNEIRYVEWVDSMGSHGWEPVDDVKTIRPQQIFTVGYVADENDDYVTFMQSYDERKSGRAHADNIICIPKFAISKSITLKKATT